MELIKFDEMKNIWRQIAKHKSGEIPPAFELEVYNKLLNLFHVGDYYYYIVNLAKVNIEMVSDQVKDVLLFDTPEEFTVEYIYHNLHPEDLPRFVLFERKVTEFFNNLPLSKIMKYKVSYDYRLRCMDGSYKWILMQTTTIQTDEDGAVIRVLGVQTDITHIKSNNKASGLSFIGLDGEISYYDVPTFRDNNSSELLFTIREKQVLQLVLSGKSSREISDLLFLSKHTVDSHRKKIFSKSGCTSLAELGAKAIKEGWL